MSRRWVVLWLVFFGIVISYVDRGNLSIAAPAIMREFRIEPSGMGVLLSAFFWTYAAFQIPAGLLVDRLGIRRAYAAGFLMWSVASASIAVSRGTGDIIGLRMLLGLAESIGPLASLSFIRNNFAGKDQGLPTSIYIAGQNIGPALGALAGTMLLSRFGWRMMFAITRLWTGRMLLGSRSFWAMTLSILLSSYYWYFVLTWIPSYLILSRGFSTLEMGRVVSTALFTMAFVNILAGFAADRLAARSGVFRVRLIFGAAGYAGTAAILLLLLVQDRMWVLPILTFSMCATGIGNSSFWAISQHVPPKNLVGRTIGYLNTVSQVAGAAAPVITGWVLGPEKQFGPAILLAGSCPVLAAMCLMLAGHKGLQRTKAMLAGDLAEYGAPVQNSESNV
jgi:ACS family D-galactonate transporter-like MFS transporter